VGTGADPDKLLAALCQMHNRARATGARTAVLTIPQFALELVRKRRNREDSSLFAVWSTDARL